jgi:hypothetical protein
LQVAHFLKAGKLQKWHYWLGIPTIIFSITSTSIIFLNSEGKPSILMASLISLIASILASLQTFYSHAGQAEKHLLIVSQLGKIKRQLEILQAFPPNKENETTVLWELSNEIERILKDSPAITIDDIIVQKDTESHQQISETIPVIGIREEIR